MNQKVIVNGRKMNLNVSQAIKDGTLTDIKIPKAERGHIYSRNRENYILACVDYYKIALISLRGGNRWSSPVRVRDIENISKKESEKIFDGFFD
jgi:hypothetical protein